MRVFSVFSLSGEVVLYLFFCLLEDEDLMLIAQAAGR